MNQTKLIKSLKLEKWFLEETGKPNSAANRFLSNFVLNFILKNLSEGKKKEFLELVASGKDKEILRFVQENSPGFEKEMAKELKSKLANLKRKVLA